MLCHDRGEMKNRKLANRGGEAARVRAVTCAQQGRQDVSAGRTLRLPAVRRATWGLFTPLNADNDRGSGGPPHQAYCLPPRCRQLQQTIFISATLNGVCCHICQNVLKTIIFRLHTILVYIHPVIAKGWQEKRRHLCQLYNTNWQRWMLSSINAAL